MTAGRGVTEVHWMSRPGACDVSHRQPAEHGLFSFLSLLGAFLINVIQLQSVIKSSERGAQQKMQKLHTENWPRGIVGFKCLLGNWTANE